MGFKIGNELTRMEVKTAADLRRVSQEKLMQKFGERIGTFLYLACRGQVSLDTIPVDHFSLIVHSERSLLLLVSGSSCSIQVSTASMLPKQ